MAKKEDENKIVNGQNNNIYTKRTCLDNSETYITSRFNMLYEKTIINSINYNSKRTLKKMIENKF